MKRIIQIVVVTWVLVVVIYIALFSTSTRDGGTVETTVTTEQETTVTTELEATAVNEPSNEADSDNEANNTNEIALSPEELFYSTPIDPKPNEEVYIFENEDGTFVFYVSPNYERANPHTNWRVRDYSYHLLMPPEDDFQTGLYGKIIPMLVEQSNELILVQEDGVIKGVLQNDPDTTICIFNTADLAFERPRQAVESEPTDHEIPALLLGLCDSEGNMRTLFIRKEGDVVLAGQIDDKIVFPYKNELHSVGYYIAAQQQHHSDVLPRLADDGSYLEWSDDEESYLAWSTAEWSYSLWSNTAIKKLWLSPLKPFTANNEDTLEHNEDEFDIIESYEEFTAKMDSILKEPEGTFGFYELSERPLFIGEDYISYVRYQFETWGGSWHTSNTDTHFAPLERINDFTAYDETPSIFSEQWQPRTEPTLAEFIFGDIAKALYRERQLPYGAAPNPLVDFRDLVIARNINKWSIMLPIFGESSHPGNGSYSRGIRSFAVFDDNVPDDIVKESTATVFGDWRHWWGAKAIVKFPDSELVLAQYDYHIEITPDTYSFDPAILKIPTAIDEYIVSINFATEDEQEIWTDILGGMLHAN
ncbi:MAG: hypothetical protein FWG87_11825 [Defluviitaleaceae bacterium]|nr:hypothetical protein [Defluviitaleaceae bacterium]